VTLCHNLCTNSATDVSITNYEIMKAYVTWLPINHVFKFQISKGDIVSLSKMSIKPSFCGITNLQDLGKVYIHDVAFGDVHILGSVTILALWFLYLLHQSVFWLPRLCGIPLRHAWIWDIPVRHFEIFLLGFFVLSFAILLQACQRALELRKRKFNLKVWPFNISEQQNVVLIQRKQFYKFLPFIN